MAVSGRGFVNCPQCKLPNPVGPTTCWSCGAPLPPPPALPSTFQVPDAPTPAPTASADRFAYGPQETTTPSYAYAPGGATALAPGYGNGDVQGSDRWLYVGLGVVGAILVIVVGIFALHG